MMNVTKVASGPSRLATRRAATTLAQDEVPAKSASSRANRCVADGFKDVTGNVHDLFFPQC